MMAERSSFAHELVGFREFLLDFCGLSFFEPPLGFLGFVWALIFFRSLNRN